MEVSPQLTSGDLGSTNHKWSNLYLSGNLTDGTKSVPVANIVDTTTNQSIGGVKRFTSGQLILEDANDNDIFAMLNTTTDLGFDVGLVMSDNAGNS